MEMFETVRETNPDTDKNNNCQEEEDSSDSDSDFEERRNLRRRPNRPRFPRRVKKEKKSEVRAEDTRRTITCKSCLIPYTYFTDQVAETPEKCRDCKRKAFLKVLQSAK